MKIEAKTLIIPIMYKIVTTPNKVLSKISDEVEQFDKKLKDILEEMEATLRATKDPIGVGLAAPQVGLSLKIFQLRPDEKSEVRSFINPEIISISDEENEYVSQSGKKKQAIEEGRIPPPKGKRLLEGCLSIPDIWGYVQRKKDVTLSYQDENGKHHEEVFTGFSAIIVQHELDHLNGVLFTQHVVEQNEKLYKSHKDEKGEDVFEEITI